MLKTLPRIVEVDDYHELLWIPDHVENYIGLKVKCKEIGYYSNNYVGIVYQNKLPSILQIKKLLAEAKIQLEDERSIEYGSK
jgi:hypothetical protein